jgi:AcrR family transcriptional regulator
MKTNEKEKASVTKRASAARGAVRSGRPPRELAGKVEKRILDAARKVFLDHGFEGASIEEIAGAARSGKPTIYARFSNKQELFAAAVTRYILAKSMEFESHTPAGTTVDERLANIGVTLIQEVLTSEVVGLIRLAIAEARRFPDLGRSILEILHERGAETMAGLLSEAAQSGELGTMPAFSPECIATTAEYFLDLILLPIVMRALSGENLETLHAGIGPYVFQKVAFFLAGCRHGGIC